MKTSWAPTRIRLCERCQGSGEEKYFVHRPRGGYRLTSEWIEFRTCPICFGRGAHCELIKTADESEYHLACRQWHALTEELVQEQATRRRLRTELREAERRRILGDMGRFDPERQAAKARIARALAARGIQ